VIVGIRPEALTPSSVSSATAKRSWLRGTISWLAILTATYGDTVSLIVESSGPPITAEQAASLFEPFRRLQADRVGSARGSGLGLSIVRAVAQAHAGEATAAPVAGGGLRVTVTLPALRPATAGARHKPAASTSALG